MRLINGLVGWSALVICGFACLARYSATAGSGDHAVDGWPADSRIVQNTVRPTLLVFLHPACPCSRATVAELAKLIAQVGRRMETRIMFIRPAGLAPGWEQTDLWKSASMLADVQVSVDPGGEEAQRFGAATSGYTLLYEPHGRLVFRGGITVLRGHEGDNAGRCAIESWIETGKAEPAETPVYGCRLLDN